MRRVLVVKAGVVLVPGDVVVLVVLRTITVILAVVVRREVVIKVTTKLGVQHHPREYK